MLVLRHQIIGHALTVTISKKSDINISLKVDSLDYGILSSTIMLYNAALHFDSLELNEEHNLRLRELRFSKIEMSGISLFRLLIFREIVADRLLVSAPSSLLTSNNQSTPAQVNPQDILNGLNKNKNLFGNLIIHIRQIQLSGGRFLMEKKHPNGVSTLGFDYGIQLRQFNTGKALFSDTTRFLFSSQMQVKLDSLHYINPFGDGIVADSVTFISGSTRLAVFGLTLNPSDSSQNKTAISAHVKHLELDGVIPDSPEEVFDVQFKAITISEADIWVSKNKPDKHVEKKPGNSLLKIIRTLELNRVNILNSNLWVTDEENDTLLNAEINQLAVENLMADSGFLLQPEKIAFENLLWDTKSLGYMDSGKRIKIELKSTSFSETNGQLILNEVELKDRNPVQEQSFGLSISRVELSGVYFSPWLQQHPIGVRVNLEKPEFWLSKKSTVKQSPKSQIQLPQNLTIVSVDISDGILSYYKQDEINLETEAINFHSGKINLSNLNNWHTLPTDSLTFSTGKLQMELFEQATKLQWARLSINHELADFKDLFLNMEGYDEIAMKGLLVESPELNSLAKGEAITTGTITCISPTYSGTIDAKKSTDKKKNAVKTPGALKTFLTTKGVVIRNGALNTQLILDTDTLHIVSKIGLTTGKLSITNQMNKNWLARLKWSLSLSQPSVTHHLGKASAESIAYDNRKNRLLVNKITIDDHRHEGNPVTINHFSMDELSMNDIDYRSLIMTNTLNFGTLVFNQPLVNVEMTKKTDHVKHHSKAIDLNELPFTFREIKLEDMKIHLTQLDSVNHTYFDMGEVDIKFTGQKPQSNHLTDHLTFSINQFAFTNEFKTHQLAIDKLAYNPSQGLLTLSNVLGNQQDSDTAMEALSYSLNYGEFDRFKVSNSFPTEISIRKISLSKPEIHYKKRGEKNTDHQEGTTGQFPTHIKLPKELQQVKIDTLILNHLDVYHAEIQPSHTVSNNLNDLRIIVNRILLDTTGIYTDNFSFVESSSIQTGKNKFISSDSLYVTNVKSVAYNFSTNTLTLDSLQIAPRYSDAEFFKKAKFQTDRINLFGARFVGSNFRLKTFLKTGTIHFGGMDVYGLNVELFRNKNYPVNPTDYKKMPQEMILDVEKPFLVDSILTHDAEIHYKEIVEKAKDPGYIYFDHFNLSLYNVTNIPEKLAADSVLLVNLKAKVMGKTNLSINLFVIITSPEQTFWFSGYTESIGFPVLNPVTQNLVGIDMQGGEGRVLIPMIKGDSSHTSGRVVFLYKKLKVGLYNREKASLTTGLARSMANILLNDIFIRSNNPTFLRKPKTGVVYTDRVTQKSFVFYIWKSILSGMLSTFGINTRQQRHEKREMNAALD